MESKVRRPQANAAKCDLVYFVGGYTLAEVAALRTVQVSLTGLVPEILEQHSLILLNHISTTI